MPLYELVCLAQHYPKQYTPLRTLVANTAAFIQSNGGAVRRMDSFGNQTLPQMIRKEGTTHSTADYWTMHFDTNPSVLKQLSQKMREDPRVLRWTTLKKGVTLDKITSMGSVIDSSLDYPTTSARDYAQYLNREALSRVPASNEYSRAFREQQRLRQQEQQEQQQQQQYQQQQPTTRASSRQPRPQQQRSTRPPPRQRAASSKNFR